MLRTCSLLMSVLLCVVTPAVGFADQPVSSGVSFQLAASEDRKLEAYATDFQDSPKPRVVVLTDVSTWETDDSESLVRLLVDADLLEIEGLVFTTGWSLGTTRDDFFDLIHVAINAYEKAGKSEG